MGMIIAIDTGGTKTLVSAFTSSGKALKRHRFATPKRPADYFNTLASLLEDEYDLKKTDAISIAMPGVIKDDIITALPHLTLWRHINVVRELTKRLADYQGAVYIENDANLAGLAEAHALSKVPRTCVYVTISTGIGTGIITDGEINPYFNQSEGGHMQLEYDGILRDWDQFASGLSIYTTYGKYAKDIHHRGTWEMITDKIARGFYAFIPLLQPQVIVIGGSVGTHFAQYEKNLKRLINQKLPPYIDRPIIKQAQHPEEAVLYGCYRYALQRLSR